MERKAQRIRDQKILEMVRKLLGAEVAFQEIFKKYKQGRLQFSDITHWIDDRGHSLLYLVKEECHSIFRYVSTKPFQRKEWLLDLAVGSIFHEAIKLRENIYQLEVYRPRYLQYDVEAGKTAYERDYLMQFKKIISRAEQGVADGMEETRSLFRDAQAQLLDFFKASAENPYLVRFLLEHRPLLQKVFGKDGTAEVFSQLFENGLRDAYWIAGQSYLESEHYELATFNFSKALKLNPLDRDGRSLLSLALGMEAYYRNDHSRALSHLSKLVALQPAGKLKREHLKKAGDACHKIAVEWREEKNRRAAGRAQSIAEQFKRMLS